MANASLKKNFKDGDKLLASQLNNNFGVIEAALNAMNKIVWQDDPDESIITFRGTTAELAARDIIDGQLLYNTDTGETYIDYNGSRISTGSGNAIHIGADVPSNASTELWIDPTSVIMPITAELKILTGSITLPESGSGIEASATLSYPTGFTYDNCVVISIMSNKEGGTRTRWATPQLGILGDMVGNGDVWVDLEHTPTDNIYVHASKSDIDANAYTVNFKIVLMKMN